MENYLMLNGKRIDLTAEQIETLVGKKEKDPFERVKINENYYLINTNDKLANVTEAGSWLDDELYNLANYCTDKELMEQRALHETLNRLLWRYSMQHGGREIDWQDKKPNKFKVVYEHDMKSFCVFDNTYQQELSTVYFHTKETAEAAIEEIVKPFMEQHPEFRW